MNEQIGLLRELWLRFFSKNPSTLGKVVRIMGCIALVATFALAALKTDIVNFAWEEKAEFYLGIIILFMGGGATGAQFGTGNTKLANAAEQRQIAKEAVK